ncbi:MAG: protein translocase subunit SecD [Chloroflexi bacterium]|nr:protein translocase subunit SecD [Chloroflexota bacterium]
MRRLRVRRNTVLLMVIALVAGMSVWAIWPQRPERYFSNLVPWPQGHWLDIKIGDFRLLRRGMTLGLDLQGGTHLVLQADLSQRPAGITEQAALEGVKRIVERRINAFGVSEPVIQTQGDNRVSVQLPGVKDVEEAKRLVGRTAQLDFRELDYGPNNQPQIDEKGIPKWKKALAPGLDGQEKELTGAYFRPNATLGFDQRTNQPLVQFEFDDEGSKLFENITRRLIGKPLGIFLDDQLISAPTVQNVIIKQGIINGIGAEEGRLLSIQLNAGALPVPVSVVKEQTVDASLGQDSIQRSIVAGLIAFAVVLLFMLLNYRLPGLLAGGALVVYASLTLAMFKIMPVTLTLAGIAAFILSVGMAVDANILIFERVREEAALGKDRSVALREGYARATWTIIDANLTTLLTALILVFMGSGPIRGFGITLSGWHGDRTQRQTDGLGLTGRGTVGMYDFVIHRKWFFWASAIMVLPGLISLMIFGLRPGIEFQSGSLMTVRFQQEVQQEQLREEMGKLGFGDAIIQHTAEGDWLIRTRELTGLQTSSDANQADTQSERAKIVQALGDRFGSVEQRSFDSVSPIVATEIVRNSALAVVGASIFILIYITWAFRGVQNSFRYGATAIVGLIHDVVLVLGVFSILGVVAHMEVDSMFVTAVLTVVGFSVHDTIVVFDRIRETLRREPGRSFDTVTNHSMLQTMGRSLNTSITVVLTLVALLLFGGVTIRPFVLALIIGIVTGTYSSIFISSMLLVEWEKWSVRRKAQQEAAAASAVRPRATAAR